jgi:hypothetical protein
MHAVKKYRATWRNIPEDAIPHDHKGSAFGVRCLIVFFLVACMLEEGVASVYNVEMR